MKEHYIPPDRAPLPAGDVRAVAILIDDEGEYYLCVGDVATGFQRHVPATLGYEWVCALQVPGWALADVPQPAEEPL